MKTKIITALILFLTLGCNKDDDTNEFTPTLPAITQEGKNTFGCYINGVLLTPRDGTGTFNSPDHGMIFWGSPSGNSDSELAIKDYKSGTGGLIDINIAGFHDNGEGSFSIKESNCHDGIDANPSVNIRCRLWDEELQAYKWYCSIEDTGVLVISRYDLENRITSGTFSCSAVNRNNPNEIIEITEGRFDIKWNLLSETVFP